MELQIKHIKQEKGINNIELAEKLGISSQYAGTMPNCKVGASLDKYEEIANVLGVKVWLLFALKEEYILVESGMAAEVAHISCMA